MQKVSQSEIRKYRSQTFRTGKALRILDLEEAVSFVNIRGFIFFWPIKGILFPSLWLAVAGERPVADAHDDPGHITWGWKDSLLGKREWYYAKVLRTKSTIISFNSVPFFYALSENYGSFEEDYLTSYEQGKLTLEEKRIYGELLVNGVLDTIELRRATRMNGKTSEARFNRALAELQAKFMILPVKVTQSGGWRYAFAYNIVARQYPEIPKLAQEITEESARQILLEQYIQSVGIAQLQDISKLFQWSAPRIRNTIRELAQQGSVVEKVQVENQTGEWVAARQLMNFIQG